jgi:hypothetical protein
MGKHPRKHELITYAESLEGKGGALSVKIGAHVAGCKACQAELDGMRGSLEFVHSAPELEPTADFTKQLLLAAQNERRLLQQRKGRQALASIVKGLSYAAGILVVGAVCFGAALTGGPNDDMTVHAAVRRPDQAAADAGLSPEVLRQAAAEVQTLVAALSFQPKTPTSPWEIEYRRAAQALGTDIEAARAALERNPGCARASQMIGSHLQRQAQTLKALYVERSL